MTRKLGFERFSGVYLWALFVVVFGLWSPHEFLTLSTAHLIASQQAVNGMIAIGLMIAMVCGEFDLSVGGNANLTGVLAGLCQTSQHWPVLPSIVVAVAIGFGIGAVNGFIVVKLRVSSFIATLAMGSVLAALLTITTNSQLPPTPTSSLWTTITQTQVLGFQSVVLYVIVLAIIVWWFLGSTPIGRRMYATGSNVEAARLSGIRTDRLSWMSLVVSGGISGIAGVLFVSLSGPSTSFGQTLLLPAFAAVFLGATQIQVSRFNVWGTLVAIIALATGAQGLQLVSGAQWLSDMFNGVALVGAVALAVSRERPSSRVRRLKRPSGEGSASGGGDAERVLEGLPPVQTRIDL
jgi:ribose transport system permease protein